MPSEICHPLAFLGALLAASSLAGCAKENNISQTADGSATVGPRGGIVDGPDDVELRVPSGALSGDTALGISVAEPSQYPALNADYELLGKVYAFTPHGQAFLSTVIVSLPDPGQATTLLRAESGGSWAPISSDMIAGRAEAAVTRFSFYAAAKPATTVINEPSCSGRGPDASAPTGSLNNLSGSVDGVDLSSMVDGYLQHDGDTLLVHLTPYAGACGHERNGVRRPEVTTIVLSLRTEGDLTTTTYPADSITLYGNTLDSTCATPAPGSVGGPNSGSGLSLAAVDSDHAVGSFDYVDGSFGSVAGSFDLPFCEPRQDLEPSVCCIE